MNQGKTKRRFGRRIDYLLTICLFKCCSFWASTKNVIKKMWNLFIGCLSVYRFVNMIMLRYTVVCPLTPSFMGSSVAQRNQRRSRPSSTACALSSNQTTLYPREASKLSSFLVSMRIDDLRLSCQLTNNISEFQTVLTFFSDRFWLF